MLVLPNNRRVQRYKQEALASLLYLLQYKNSGQLLTVNNNTIFLLEKNH